MTYRNITEITMLKAYSGDCILIKTFTTENKEFIILIDGGTSSTFDYYLKKELEKIEIINILILTHIDSDHIGGLIKMFQNSIIDKIIIDEIWMNFPELVNVSNGELISFGQANTFKDLIIRKKPKTIIKSISTNNKNIIINGLIFTILSPTQEILDTLFSKWEYSSSISTQNENISISFEDNTFNNDLRSLSLNSFNPSTLIDEDIKNAASISFLLICPDKSILLLADSRPEIIEHELENLGFANNKKLVCNYMKISHHGSKNNTSNSLLGRINCLNYIISTNGGSSRHKHPSRETIARLVYNEYRDMNDKISICTNYPISEIMDKIGEFLKVQDFEDGNWMIENKNIF